MKKVISLLLAAVLAIGLLAGCGSSSSSSSDDSDKLIMATNANFPPYEYMDGDEYLGIDVEIAQAIAEKLGMELEIQNVEFGSIIGGVQSGKFDMGMAGMTVTDERKESVNFSDTYATAIQVVIVKEDSDIQSIDDIGADTLIGVQQDTTGHIYAEDDYGTEAVTAYKNGADAVQALITDKVNCVIIDSEPAKNFVAANEGLKILDSAYAEEEYAIAVNKDNEELLEQINNALTELTNDGTIDEIVGKYIKAE